MDWLKKAAPWLVTALTGGVPGIAAMAAGRLAEWLGTSDKTVEGVIDALQGLPPDKLVEIKRLDAEFARSMQELGYRNVQELERIAAADRDSARGREIKTGDSWTPRVLAAVIVGGFLATVYMVLSGYVAGLKDPMIAALVGTLIGYVSAKADQVVSYYFGSSAGSKVKDDLLYRSRPDEGKGP